MGTDQITVGNWHKKPRVSPDLLKLGVGGLGLLEVMNQGEHSKQNTTETPIVENDLEEQAVDELQENY